MLPQLRVFLAVVVALSAGSAPPLATADLVVVPSSLASAEGDRTFGFNFAVTFQQLYGASQLAGLSPGDQLTAMQFRLTSDVPTGPPAELTASNFDIYLGPSSVPVGSLSNVVASNQGPGTTLTRSGALTIPPLSYPGGPGPNDFGLLIPFATPYTYTGGSLLLTLSYTNVSPGGALRFDAGSGLPDVQARTGLGYASPRVEFGGPPNYGLVVQFTTVPAPEPGGLLLFAVGISLIGVMHLKRARRASGPARCMHDLMCKSRATAVVCTAAAVAIALTAPSASAEYVWDGIYYSEPPPGVVWAPSLPLLADFTSDGIPDQISANFIAREVAVRPGSGDGTFGDPISSFVYAPGGGASGVADLNSDGQLDVFVVSYLENITGAAWGNELFNHGAGSFFTHFYPVDFVGYPLLIPYAIGTGDLFGTGRTDVVVAGTTEDYLDFYVVLANTLLGDFNRNGSVDAADYVVWRKTLGTNMPNYSGADGNGNGVVDLGDHAVWRAHFGETLPAGAGSLVATAPEPATAVLFGAGLVAVCGAYFHRSQLRRTRRRANRHAVRRPSFEALEDRSMLSFAPAVSYPLEWGRPVNIKSADFTGDEIPDLATLELGDFTGTVSVLPGNPDGTFQSARSSYGGDSALMGSLAVGDFDEDGRLDLAMGTIRDDDWGYGVDDVVVLFGRELGAFEHPVYLGTGRAAESIATGDLNGDGNLDLVVTSSDNNQQQLVSVLIGGGDGIFAPPATFYPNGYLPSPVLADFDADGNLDLAGGRQLFLGEGDGTFREPSDFGTYAYYGTTVDDYDGDGNLDLAGTGLDSVAVLRGNGDGTFQQAQSFAAGSNPAALTAADVNGDNVLDLVVTNFIGLEGGLTVLLGNGDGSFGQPITTLTGGSYTASVVVADFNDDGRADAAAANYWSITVSVLLNDRNWPEVGLTLPGDYNRNGTVDAADYVVWRKTLGSSVPNLTAADGNGNGVVDQDDQAVWRAHIGETLPAVGAGSLLAATPEHSASVESVVVREEASANGPADPEKRGSIEPPGTSTQDGALAVLDSWLPQFVLQGNATTGRLPARPTADSGMYARGNDVLLVRLAAPRFDQQSPERGPNSRLTNKSSEKAVEARREALDIAFSTLERAALQLGGNMLYKVWAGLCVGLVTLALQSWCLAARQYFPGEPMADLNTLPVNPIPNAVLRVAHGLNDSGQIVGEMLLGDGETEAFLLTPCPRADGVRVVCGRYVCLPIAAYSPSTGCVHGDSLRRVGRAISAEVAKLRDFREFRVWYHGIGQ